MAPVTVEDIEETLKETVQRWDYEITDAARRWRAWGTDSVVKDFVRQMAFNHLKRQLDNNELQAEYLRVDVVYALMEAMLNPNTMKRTARNLRCRALMRQTLQAHTKNDLL
ncbi:hypothetical protein H0H87_007985 [Tephrocybe sp. NHM501043]|nr:hypothetical protein H0H87_007985 [Tephrocybe sp. NHM501043]